MQFLKVESPISINPSGKKRVRIDFRLKAVALLTWVMAVTGFPLIVGGIITTVLVPLYPVIVTFPPVVV